MTVGNFDKFSPRRYLVEQYSEIIREEEFILRFLHEAYQSFGQSGLRILEVGGGPTVYQLLSAGKYAKEIIFTDFLQKNLDEVKQWKMRDSRAFSWKPYVSHVATLEGRWKKTSSVENRLRKALKEFVILDILQKPHALSKKRFDVVSSHFCADSITNDRRVFVKAVSAIADMVSPKGMLVMSLLKGSAFYEVGKHSFPAYLIDETSMRLLLKRLGFKKIEIQTIEVEERNDHNANICLWARR